MEQGQTYYDKDGNPIPDPYASKSEAKKESAPSLGSRLLDAGVNTLPAIGGMAGTIAGGLAATPETLGLGTIPGAIGGAAVGGAGGTALRNIINIARGKQQPQTLPEAALDQAQGAANAATAEMVPIGLKLRAPAMREGTANTWTNAAGNTSPDATAQARNVLSSNRGRLVASNTASIGRDAAQGGTDAVKPIYRASTTGGPPELVQAGEDASKSSLWPTYYAHKAGTEAADNPKVPLNALQSIAGLVSSPSARAAMAQQFWNKAVNIDPVGQLARTLVLSLLTPKSPQ